MRDLPEDAVISFSGRVICGSVRRASSFNTGYVKAFRLTSLAGAYWRGNEKIRCLRVFMEPPFPDKEQLEAHLARIEEAKKRDHRKLGKELGLFTLMEEGPGFPFSCPRV